LPTSSAPLVIPWKSVRGDEADPLRESQHGSGDKADLVGILEQSRHNNALDGITGVLWSDGTHFLQAFEGPAESVRLMFERIRADGRHHDLRLLADRAIVAREFGNWNMIHRRATDAPDLYDVRIRRLLSETPESIRQPFLALIASGDVAS
jgi:hypothetical protein